MVSKLQCLPQDAPCAYNPASGCSFVNLCVLGGFRFFLTTKDTKVHEGKPHEGNHTRGSLAHWNCISRENIRPLPESELPGVVGILHGQRVRSASRARVQ